MRAAAIFGLGSSSKDLKPFQQNSDVEWRIGMPASSTEADAVVVFGGDGTVHRHLSSLAKLNLPVLVVPCGSGNDFARALGLRKVRDSVAAWQKFLVEPSNVRTIDLGTITPLAHKPTLDGEKPHYFCCIAGLGLDAEVASRANRLPRWLRGHGGYALRLPSALVRFAALPMKISVPSDVSGWSVQSDVPIVLAAFANTPVYGGGMNIAPQARLDDGKLDVCLVRGINPFKLFCLFPTVYFGGHLRMKKEVNYFSASRLRVETEHPLEVYADGEFVCQTPIDVGVAPAALRVIIPG